MDFIISFRLELKKSDESSAMMDQKREINIIDIISINLAPTMKYRPLSNKYGLLSD